MTALVGVLFLSIAGGALVGYVAYYTILRLWIGYDRLRLEERKL